MTDGCRYCSFESQQALLALSLTYTIGFVFVNLGYVIVNVSLAETLRSAEPVVSVVLALLCLTEEKVTYRVVVSLVPIVIGGAFSSMGDDTFSLEGLGFVTVSNVAFSVRSVLTKKAKKCYQGNSVSVFYHVSRIGVLFLVFILAIGEMFSNLIGDGYLQIPHDLNLETMSVMLLNGLAYSIYNQMSFFVLSKVDMVTHAVANAVRRTVTIVCSVWYFGNEISGMNALGIVSSVVGVMMYAKAKRAFMDEPTPKGHRGLSMHWNSNKA